MNLEPVRSHVHLRGDPGPSLGAVAFRLLSLALYGVVAVVGPQLGIALARFFVG